MMALDYRSIRRLTEAEAVQRSWGVFWRVAAADADRAGNPALAAHSRNRATNAERRASELRGQVLASR